MSDKCKCKHERPNIQKKDLKPIQSKENSQIVIDYFPGDGINPPKGKVYTGYNAEDTARLIVGLAYYFSQYLSGAMTIEELEKSIEYKYVPKKNNTLH